MKHNLTTIGNRIKNFYRTQIQASHEPALMHNKILISFSSNPKQPSAEEPILQVDWLIRDAHGNHLETVLRGDLSQLKAAEEDEIQVVVPAQEILLTEVTLPPLNAYRLQQALPYALEEQVLDELELLHFTPAPPNPVHGKTPVAIVKKTVLTAWLSLCHNQGLHPDQLIPAIFTLPYHENQWQVLIQGNTATVRTGLYAGFSSELDLLETLLTLKQEEELQAPKKLLVYQDPKTHFTFSTLTLPLEIIPITVEQKQAMAAATLDRLPALNLLQGAYTSKRKLRIPEKNKRAFRLAAYTFSIWLGVLLLSQLGSLFILSYEHHHLRNQIAEIYHSHFPKAGSMFDARTQMETKLKKAFMQSEKIRLFQWLAYLTKTNSPVRIQSFTFQNKQLSLELLAASFASLDEFMLSLKAQGLEVKQQTASLAGNQVKAVLLIEGKAT